MRILVLSNLYPPHHKTDYELVCQDIVASLKSRQHRIKVLTSTYGIEGPRVEDDIHRMLTIDLKDYPNWRDILLKEFNNQTYFKKICLDFKPEICFFFNLSLISLSTHSLAEGMRIPTCSYYANNWFVTREKDQWHQLWPEGERGFKILRFLAHRFKLLPPRNPLPPTFSIFANRYLKDVALELKKSTPDSVVIPWGVDIKRFPFKKRRIQGAGRFLYVGQIQPDQGVEDAIKALSFLKHRDKQNGLSMTIAGDETSSPDYVAYLKDLADKLGILKNLSFVGQVPQKEMPNLYHSHDILVSPSHTEDSAERTLLEAMSSGIAVVSTSTEGNSTILEDDTNALMFPKNDPNFCAKQILRLLEDNKLWESLRLNARNTVEKKFPIEHSIDSLEKILRQTAEKPKSGDPIKIARLLPFSEKSWRDASMNDLIVRAKRWLIAGKLVVFVRILLKPKSFLQMLKRFYQKTGVFTPYSVNRIIFDTYSFLKGQHHKRPDSDPRVIQNILVVQIADIGDVILSSPFLRELRRFYPKAWISLAVQPRIFNLIEKCPYVDEVIAFDWRTTQKKNSYLLGFPRWWMESSRIAKINFWTRDLDMAISTRWNEDPCQAASLILMYASGAGQKIAYKDTSPDPMLYGWKDLNRLITRGPSRGFPKHEVEHQLDILRFLGATPHEFSLEVWTSKEDELFARSILDKHGVAHTDPIIAFAPGAAWPFRRWSSDRFIELGEWLQKNYNTYILIFAGKDEHDLALRIERGLHKGKTVNLAGKTTLREMASILRRCTLFIGNDSGPLHVATAAGIPVVGFYGPGEYERFKPWGSNHETLRLGLSCSPCSQNCLFDEPRCIKGITVNQVKNCLARKLASILDPS